MFRDMGGVKFTYMSLELEFKTGLDFVVGKL